jgi:glycosyltransferase involved in cell wall biosynthesis
MKNLLMITGLGAVESLAQGKNNALYNTLEELHAHWERIDIVCPQVKNQSVHAIFGNVHIHCSPFPLVFHPVYFIYKIVSLHRTVRFDLMTVHEFPPFYNGVGARIVSWLTGIPYVLEIMHIPGVPRAANAKEVVYRFLTRLFIAADARGARAVRVINQKQTPDFLTRAGVPVRKILYVPAFYIDTDIFRPAETPKKYDLVYVARLEKNKGILQLIEAVDILKKRGRSVSLLIIGSGPLGSSLKNKIIELGLQDVIHFAGWLPTAADVAEAYRSARVFVNPALNEGGPRVALEAMACGLPVVTTRVGVMLDIIQDGKNGLFTDWSSKGLAESIWTMLVSPELYEACSAAGPVIAGQFERKAMVKKYAETLQSI